MDETNVEERVGLADYQATTALDCFFCFFLCGCYVLAFLRDVLFSGSVSTSFPQSCERRCRATVSAPDAFAVFR